MIARALRSLRQILILILILISLFTERMAASRLAGGASRHPGPVCRDSGRGGPWALV